VRSFIACDFSFKKFEDLPGEQCRRRRRACRGATIVEHAQSLE